MRSLSQVVEAFKKASGKEVPYKVVGRREGDVAIAFCDSSRAWKDLEWRAEKNLQDMCMSELNISNIISTVL